MAVTIDNVVETGPVGWYYARVTVADDGDTLEIPLAIQGAVFQPNRDQAASDSSGLTFTAGDGTLTFNLVGTVASVSGSLIVWGDA